MPRAANGRIQPIEKPKPRQPTDWEVLYQWRDARRDYAALLKRTKHEERWGGVRSLAIVASISSVLVFFLVAGVTGG
jgi:hypothetical protein